MTGFCAHRPGGPVARSRPGRLRRRVAVLARQRRGVALDALAAVEPTSEPELRRTFFGLGMHAWHHADLCRARARGLGRASATEASREEAGLLFEHGIVAGRTRWERLGPGDFLAHLCLVGEDTVARLGPRGGRTPPDPETARLIARVQGEAAADADACRTHLPWRGEARGALRRVRWGRLKEGWLRLSARLGAAMATVLLTLVYLLVVGPFRLFARGTAGGWHPPRPRNAAPLDQAREEG